MSRSTTHVDVINYCYVYVFVRYYHSTYCRIGSATDNGGSLGNERVRRIAFALQNLHKSIRIRQP